ncbi:hypothetical protein GCM10022295_60720 [Streptomyces osmaniensis]|uniref:Uncharacterized protein n=1 Tax=Streptomyces osmaniensis TaxID=593134 RepID=A0ABP6XVG9_9ACTN
MLIGSAKSAHDTAGVGGGCGCRCGVYEAIEQPVTTRGPWEREAECCFEEQAGQLGVERCVVVAAAVEGNTAELSGGMLEVARVFDQLVKDVVGDPWAGCGCQGASDESAGLFGGVQVLPLREEGFGGPEPQRGGGQGVDLLPQRVLAT